MSWQTTRPRTDLHSEDSEEKDDEVGVSLPQSCPGGGLALQSPGGVSGNYEDNGHPVTRSQVRQQSRYNFCFADKFLNDNYSFCLTWLSCPAAPEGEVETGGHSGAVVGVVKGPVAAVKSKLRGFYCIFYHKNRNSNNCETETVHNQDPNGALLHHRPGLDTPMEISHCQSFQIMDFISLIWLVLWGPLCSSKLSGTIQTLS